MNIAQREHADAYRETLPVDETLARLEGLFHSRRAVMNTARNRRIRLEAFDDRYSEEDWQISDVRIRAANELTQAEMKLADYEKEIIEVARLIVAEANNAELITSCNCLNRERNIAETAADAEIAEKPTDAQFMRWVHERAEAEAQDDAEIIAV